MTNDIETYIDLLPDVYDKATAPVASNNRKIFQSLGDIFDEVIVDIEDVRQVKDLQNAVGDQLDRIGDSYRLPRYGKTDDAYRAFILAKIFAQISGNGYDKILNYFRFFIPEPAPLRIMDLWSDEAAAIFNGNRVPRAISVEVGVVAPSLEAILYSGLQILKAAGIYANVNVKAFMLAQSYDVPIATPILSQASLKEIYIDQAIVVRDVILAFGSLTTYGNSKFIYRSTDSGLTWQEVTLPSIVTIKSFAINRDGVVVAVALKYTANNVFSIVVLRSVDLGATWVEQAPLEVLKTIVFAEINHANGIFLILTTRTPIGYYRSSDGGLTWTFILATPLGYRDIIPRASTNDNSDMFYATTTALPSGVTSGPVLKSEDGLVWTPLTLPIPIVGFPTLDVYQAVFVSPDNVTWYYSLNQGRTWVVTGAVGSTGQRRMQVVEIGGSFRTYGSTPPPVVNDQIQYVVSHNLGVSTSVVTSAPVTKSPFGIVGAVFVNGVVVIFGNSTSFATYTTANPNPYLANYSGTYAGGTFAFTDGKMTTYTGGGSNIGEATARSVVYSLK